MDDDAEASSEGRLGSAVARITRRTGEAPSVAASGAGPLRLEVSGAWTGWGEEGREGDWWVCLEGVP